MLFREKINDWESFTDEKTSGVYPYRYSNSFIAGWLDISSIETIDLYGFRAGDAVKGDTEIKQLFEDKPGSTESAKWAICSQAEKTILARRQQVSKVLRLEVYTEIEDNVNFAMFAGATFASRQARTDTAKVQLGYNMDVADRQDLYDVTAEKINRYVSSGDPDLQNWMESKAPYISTGFSSKTYFTQELLDIYISIVLEGNY